MAAVDYPRFLYGIWTLTHATVTAGTEESGYPAINVQDENLHTFWKPDGTSWQYLKFDFGGVKYFTACSILGHTLYSAGVLDVQLKVGAADNGTNFDTTIWTWTPAADTNRFQVFAALGKRYCIITSNVVSTHPAIAVVQFGYVTTEMMLSRPDRRFTDHGTAVEESAGGLVHAENYAESREGIYLTATGITDTARAAFQTIEGYHKNGLHPLCFIDMGVEAAYGACTYGRIFDPLSYSSPAPDANDLETRLFKQEL